MLKYVITGVATPTEKAEARRTQKGKCYWMDVTFSLSALELWRRTYLGLASTSSSSSSSSSSFAGVEEVEHVSLTDVLKKRAKEQGVIDLTLFRFYPKHNMIPGSIRTCWYIFAHQKQRTTQSQGKCS